MRSGSEEGNFLRLMDFEITINQKKKQKKKKKKHPEEWVRRWPS